MMTAGIFYFLCLTPENQKMKAMDHFPALFEIAHWSFHSKIHKPLEAEVQPLNGENIKIQYATVKIELPATSQHCLIKSQSIAKGNLNLDNQQEQIADNHNKTDAYFVEMDLGIKAFNFSVSACILIDQQTFCTVQTIKTILHKHYINLMTLYVLQSS